jgi:hypothetical protein
VTEANLRDLLTVAEFSSLLGTSAGGELMWFWFVKWLTALRRPKNAATNDNIVKAFVHAKYYIWFRQCINNVKEKRIQDSDPPATC